MNRAGRHVAIAALAVVACTSLPRGAAGGCDPAAAVPLVTAVDGDGLVKAQAGMVVSASGLVLTQWGWLRSADRIAVALPGRAPVPARVAGASEARDLALLEPASADPVCPVSFGDPSEIRVAESVRVYGYPFPGRPPSGFVIGVPGKITVTDGPPVRSFRSDMAVGPGFAGGPVVDSAGKVIGILALAAPGVTRAAWSGTTLGWPALIEQLRRGSGVPTRAPGGTAGNAGAAADRRPPGRDLNVAVHVSLSGPGAAVGRAIVDGAAQAVAEIRPRFEAHGFHVALVPLDDRGVSAGAVANVRRRLLGDPSVLLVIGHNSSGVCQDAAPVYAQAGLAAITPACEVATVTDSGWPTTFRVIGRDDTQGAAAAQFARSALRAQSAYVVYERDGDYGLRMAAAFSWEAQHLGLRVNDLAPVDPAAVGAAAAGAAAAKPDVVYYAGGARGAGLFLRALRALGAGAQLIGPDALDSSEFAYFAAEAAPGAYYTVLDGPARFYEDAAPFDRQLRARTGRDAGPWALLGHDAAGIGLEALVRAAVRYGRAPTRREVVAALRDPALSYRGITGTIRFTANGDRVDSPVFVVQVRGPAWGRWMDNTLVTTIVP